MQNMKMTDRFARHENAGNENDGYEIAGHDNTGNENRHSHALVKVSTVRLSLLLFSSCALRVRYGF